MDMIWRDTDLTLLIRKTISSIHEVILKQKGSSAAIISCLFTAIMGLLFYQAHLNEPHVPSIVGSLFRVFGNFIFLAPWLMKDPQRIIKLNHSTALWLWGIFGALTVLTYFNSLEHQGAAITNILNSSNGVLILILAPFLVNQVPGWPQTMALVGAVAGTILVIPWNHHEMKISGDLFSGAISGLFAALAFLMVAKVKRNADANLILLVWFQVNILMHLCIILFTQPNWPHLGKTWIFYLSAGLIAAFAQKFQAIAYQYTSAARAAGLSYLTPIFSLSFEGFSNKALPSSNTLWGALILVSSGLVAVLTKDK